MRKKISAIYSKAFPKKSGEEYSAEELAIRFLVWSVALAGAFFLLKYGYDAFHLK